MNQKIFQCIVLTVVLCASLLLGINGCSATASAPTSQIQQKDITVVSSIAENHAHNLTIKWEDIVDANKTVVYTTTENGTPLHSHTVTLSPQNFKDIAAGKTVTVTSAPPAPGIVVVSNHVHVFVIKK